MHVFNSRGLNSIAVRPSTGVKHKATPAVLQPIPVGGLARPGGTFDRQL